MTDYQVPIEQCLRYTLTQIPFIKWVVRIHLETPMKCREMINDNGPRRDPAITSHMMAKVRSKNSKAELTIRRMLHVQGYRFRIHYDKVYGRPDIVFTRQKIAVFIDGDFWHGNAWRLRGLPSLAAQFPNRTEWWVDKLERTMQRDRAVTDRLASEGWRVLRFWESDVVADPVSIVKKIVSAMN